MIMNETLIRRLAMQNERIGNLYNIGPVLRAEVERFAELIVQECITQCEQVATNANAMAESKFVTDMGRQLHEGMWGGAKNCTAQIREHFGVEE